MKKTLQSFIEKTATSRDANEFLLRYSGVDSSVFLLVIVRLLTENELEELCVQVDDLLALELKPTLWLHEELCEGSYAQALARRYEKSDILWKRESELGWESCLQNDLESRNFYKVIWTGGALRDQYGQIVNRVQLSHDQVFWSDDSQSEINWIRPLLEGQGPSMSLQCVEPHLLMPELFTRKGSGTLVSQGYYFEWVKLSDLEIGEVRELIESGFGRKLKDDYFQTLPMGTQVLLEKEHRGAVVLIPAPGFTYVDKVVVEPEYLGRGMGSLLLDELLAKLSSQGKDSLAWRARHDNPFLGRYAQVIHGQSNLRPLTCGTLSDESYIYHYLGVDPESLRGVVRWISGHCSSFVED